MSNETTVRPTKKQRELLDFIEQFIGQHGYSPSYREVMNGMDYTSVATVSLHINSLIKRGHLRKRDRSARSLEVVKTGQLDNVSEIEDLDASHEKGEQWLLDRIESTFEKAESMVHAPDDLVDELAVLVSSLRVLGLKPDADAYMPRLEVLVRRTG